MLLYQTGYNLCKMLSHSQGKDYCADCQVILSETECVQLQVFSLMIRLFEISIGVLYLNYAYLSKSLWSTVRTSMYAWYVVRCFCIYYSLQVEMMAYTKFFLIILFSWCREFVTAQGMYLDACVHVSSTAWCIV